MRPNTNRNASLSLKSEKRQALTQSGCSQARPSIWANCHSKSADRPSWVPGPRLSFGSIWNPFLGISEPKIAPKCVFDSYSKNQSLFLDIQVFKVIIILQINILKRLDYPQPLYYLIIHFIPMQAGLFLVLTNNQSQNYLINFNFLTNQN